MSGTLHFLVRHGYVVLFFNSPISLERPHAPFEFFRFLTEDRVQ